MSSNSYLRTPSLRRVIRAVGLLMLLACMQRAMPAAASPAYWSIKVARPSFTCQRGLGICIDLFGADGTAATRVSFEVEGPLQGQPGTRQGRLAFLTPLAEKGDTFEIEEDVVLDRRHSLELGYQSVTLLKGRYAIDRSNGGNGDVLIGLRTIGITITADIGRRAHDCERFGICSITVGASFDMKRPAPASASLDGNRLSVDFLLPIDAKDSATLYIDEDIVLDEPSSLALGAKRVTILKGAYAVDYSENPNGHVDVPVARFGITVTIDVGRKSLGCTRAGICEITIDFSFRTAASTPAVVSLEGSNLLVDFLGRPHSGREPFVLDEDFIVHRDLAARLGRQELTLKAGTYEIDFSVNPNGRLVIPVTSQGIVVTIHIGRPTQNCRGFGFCGITIDPSASERTVPSVVSIRNGVMAVDFLAEAPESGDVLTLDEDLTLDAKTAHRFGYDLVRAKRGEYRVDRSVNAFGHVEIPVATNGIRIEIDFGRTSACNPGFGVCRIIVDLLAKNPSSERTGIAAAVESGSNRMVLFFSEPVAFAADTLVIDDDVLVDGATGAPAGAANRLWVKRGAYPVDYSSDPNGSVTVVTELEGAASVGTTLSDAGSTLALWPNPATGTVATRFSVDGTQPVRLELIDAHGAVVLTAIDGERLERGTHLRTLDLSGLTAGAYFERLSIGTVTSVRPLQIVR